MIDVHVIAHHQTSDSEPCADGDLAREAWMPWELERHVRQDALLRLREESRIRTQRLQDEAVVRQRRAISRYLVSESTQSLGTPEELQQRLDSVRAALTNYRELGEQLVKVATLKNDVLVGTVELESFSRKMVIEVLANAEMELRWNVNSKLCNLAGLLGLLAPADMCPPVERLFPSLKERLVKTEVDEDVKAILCDLKIGDWLRLVNDTDLSARADCVLASVVMQQRVEYAAVAVCSMEPSPSASSVSPPGLHRELLVDKRTDHERERGGGCFDDHMEEGESGGEDREEEEELIYDYGEDDDEEDEEEELVYNYDDEGGGEDED